mmetsp:Transcript_25973/g.60301  ORF Transcript_25973/g.60301 Transcript_25973/m.60301 type:complete len:646 (+) Transcript_25973:1438-3375(+)
MCGILGIHFNQSLFLKYGEVRFKKALATLSHRGPDTQSWWISPTQDHFLGHACLKIVDPAACYQPISNQANNIHMVSNGEFYQYESLREELVSLGYTFKTKSDTEVALYAYEAWGTACLDRLEGEFAFIIYDAREDTIFAVRDRFGVKPLFYTIYEDGIIFASEMKSLFALGIPAIWNEAEVFNVIKCLAHLSSPASTLFKDVYQVPPGHLLIKNAYKRELHQYWDVQSQVSQHTIPNNTTAIVEMAKTLLKKSVVKRLKAAVPVACYMSGGIDSAGVAGIAAKLSSRPLQGFTISFDDARYDELRQTQEMADFAHIDLHALKISHREMADYFEQTVYHTEFPFCGTNGISKLILSKYVQDRGFRVILNGEGGDEIFGGYPSFMTDYLEQAGLPNYQKVVEQLRNENNISLGVLMPQDDQKVHHNKWLQQTLGFTPSWVKTFLASAKAMDALVAKDVVARYNNYEPYRTIGSLFDRAILSQSDKLRVSMYLWLKLVMPHHILSYEGDRTEMAHSVEGRVPLLDHHLAAYIWALSSHTKMKRNTEKYILRQAVREFVPPSFHTRKKHPFMAPSFLLDTKNALYQLMHDHINSQAFQALPFFDRHKVIMRLEKMTNATLYEATVMENNFCIMLGLLLLQKKFKVSTH